MNFNFFIIALLRSPLHGILSGSFILLTYTGRKSGKRYTVPVNYIKVGESLVVTSTRARTWWRSLRGGAPVTLRLRGRDHAARAESLEDPVVVGEVLSACFKAAPQMARYFQVDLDPGGQPLPADVERAARERVVVRIEVEK